jgi:hypothetical protein
MPPLSPIAQVDRYSRLGKHQRTRLKIIARKIGKQHRIE